MRYRIVFANNVVGQAQMPPVEIDTPDAYGVADRTSDVARQLRARIVQAITAAPAPGAEQAGPVTAANTNIALSRLYGAGAAC